MSFFLKGDFKIQESWEQKPPSRVANSRQKQKEKNKNKSLVNAGKNIIYEPSHDLLDDELTKKILKDLQSQIPLSSKMQKKSSPKQEAVKLPPRQKSNNNPQSQNDLITTMAARLKTVQMTCKNQREQIKEKGELLEKLKSQNTFLKGYRDNASQQYEKMKIIQSQNEQLKKKVEQMQIYLKKYGLKWVGNKIEGKLQHEKMKKDISKGNYQYRLPSEIDINTIMRRAQELNSDLHSQGLGTQIYQQNGVHKFRKAEALPMGFFSNGIAIKGYRFFPYKSKQSLQILSDLVDGYFPYVLKGRFPNGVFLKIVDKISQKYQNESSSQSINTFESNSNNDFKPPSKQQFLNKLPKQVIKNGKVINIRSEIQKRMNGQSQKLDNKSQNQFLEQNQTGVNIFKTLEYQQIVNHQMDESDVCTLKIRTQEGKVYILHMDKDKNLKDVYTWMSKINKNQFKLMSNFPRRAYEESQKQTLEELGFYPNAMLHIQTNTS